MLTKSLLSIIFLSTILFTLTVSAKFIQPDWGFSEVQMFPTAPYISDISTISDVKNKISEQYVAWKGVKYKWGGTTSTGIDCSALTQEIFASGLSKNLPRTTHQQIRTGKKVNANELIVGDLVFF